MDFENSIRHHDEGRRTENDKTQQECQETMDLMRESAACRGHYVLLRLASKYDSRKDNSTGLMEWVWK